MMPEPSSDCRPMSVSSITTLGTTLAATCSTLPAGVLAAGTLGPPRPITPAGGRCQLPVCSTTDATPPPMPADTTAMASAPTVKAPARERFRGARTEAAAGCRGRPGLTRADGSYGAVRRLLAVAPVVAAGYGCCCPWPDSRGPTLIGAGRYPGCCGGGEYLG